MPDGYKLPKLTLAQFEEALLIYLDMQQKQLEKDPGWREGWVGQKWAGLAELMPGEGRFARTRTKEYTDNLYDYYMDLAETQGVGPWLPDYPQILSVGAPERLRYELGEQYESKIEKWRGEAVKSVQEQWGNKLQLAQFEALERERELDRAYRQEQFEFQKGQAQRQWAAGQTQVGMRMAEQWNEQRRLELAQRAQMFSEESRRLASWGVDRERETNLRQQEKFAEDFERMRRQITSSTAPRDWVIREKAQRAENPYAREEETWEAQKQRNVQELKALTKSEKDAYQNLKDLRTRQDDSIVGNDPSEAEVEVAQFRWSSLRERAKASERVIARGEEEEGGGGLTSWGTPWSEPRGDVAVGFEVGEPGGGGEKAPPRIPASIQPYVSGPRFGAPIVMPSMGDLMRMPAKTRETLWGYAEGMGQDPEDILKQMQVKLPRTPRTTQRWAPQRQRV